MAKVISAAEAAALIGDGMTVAVDGFIGFSLAEDILCEMEERFLREGHPRDLRLGNVAGVGGGGGGERAMPPPGGGGPGRGVPRSWGRASKPRVSAARAGCVERPAACRGAARRVDNPGGAGAPGGVVGGRCGGGLGARGVRGAASPGLWAFFSRKGARRCFGARPACRPQEPGKRLWDILWPVEGGRCLASALHTAENMLVPACLAVCLQFSGGRAEAVAQYGNLKGMALPLLTFPFGLLGSLSVLLMPEITQAHLRGQSGRLAALIDRMLRLTGYFSALAGAAFWVWGQPLAEALYGSAEAGSYLVILGPAMPLMYLESMVDGAMKGVGEQKAVFRYSMWDSCLRIVGVLLLLPRFGMKGFLFVILLSSFYTCTANTGRLLSSCGLRLQLWRWLGAPGFAGAVSAGAGLALRHLLADWLTGGAPLQLAAVALGGAGMAAVCFAAAWPLGLGEELRAVAAGERRHKKNVQKVK